MYGIGDFDPIYKRQTAPDKFWRYRFGIANLNFTTKKKGVDTYKGGIGFGIGKEKRKAITDKLYFVRGGELIGDFNGWTLKYPTDEINRHYDYSLGFGLVLGVQYQIFKELYASLELIPSLNLVGATDVNINPTTDKSSASQFGANAGFNSNSVALSFVYCFSTDKK